MAEEQTAQEAWAAITNLFLDNQMTRAVYLEAEFRGIVQGDRSITAYCHRLKSLSDALRDVGTPVTDQALVLNCLRGLNPRFADITTIVTMQNPLPSFAQTRSLLTLRETQLAHANLPSNQTAMYGAHFSTNAGPSFNNDNRGGDRGDGSRNGGGGNRDGNGNRNGGGYYRKKKNGGGNGGNYNTNSSGAPRPSNYERGESSRGNAPSVGPWVCFNPYTGQAQQLQAPPAVRPSGAGLLGPRPGMYPPAQAFTSLAPAHGQAFGTNPPPIPGYGGTSPSWDCSALMAALNNAASASTVGEWVMDSGATAHMASDPGMLHSLHEPTPFSQVTVGNGSTLPISHIGHTSIPASAHNLLLSNVLVVPHLVKNLISIRRFTIDNFCSIEFDPFGFSIKDLRTRAVIIRCNSQGDLYVFPSSVPHHSAHGFLATSTNTELWHRRLGHLCMSLYVPRMQQPPRAALIRLLGRLGLRPRQPGRPHRLGSPRSLALPVQPSHRQLLRRR
jgi:hypothetical protein